MKYLLAVTLGPVQAYIEESEKFIDLKNASSIVSDLMKNIIKYVKQRDSRSQLIYPKYDISSNEAVESIVDCTNYLVFEINKKVKLETLEEKIYENMDGDPEIFKEAFFLFWGIEKLEDSEDYYDSYDNLQRLMNGIKHTYEFNNTGEFWENNFSKTKCHICGKRSIKKKEKKEDLCSICLHKREYNDENYESNYSIAIRDWKEKHKDSLVDVKRLLKETLKREDKYYSISEIENTISMLEKGDRKSKRFKNFFNDLDQKLRQQLKEKKLSNGFFIKRLRDIQRELKNLYENEDKSLNISEPNYEYGFIQFDIDSLGEWIHGKFIDENKDNQWEDLKDYQGKISGFLISFGKVLRKELNGKCDIIYSGGDDFLAMMPIEKIQFVSAKIGELFKENVKLKLENIGVSKEITYSMCITIAPCKVPIGEVLYKSRLELNKVKEKYEIDNKNGVVFNYIVGDGATVTAYMKRYDFNRFMDLIEEYEKIENIFSLSFIRKHQSEFMNFQYEEISKNDFRNLRHINKIEIKRIMKASKLIHEEKENEELKLQKYIDEMVEFMDSLFYENHISISANGVNLDFENYANIMDIYERLCRLLSFCEDMGGDADESIEVKTKG